MELIAFSLLSAIVLLAAIAVIASRNPVHSVLWLILAFFTSAGLFVLIGAEFIAMLLVVVYVGAVAVLFLFVVMMLDVDFVELKQGFLNYAPFGFLIAVVFFAQLALVSFVTGDQGRIVAPERSHIADIVLDAKTEVLVAAGLDRPRVFDPSPNATENTEAIGRVMYTDNVLLFQLAGIILLIAMIGAIVLTLRHRPGVRRQSIAEQTARTRGDAIELRDVKPGQGI